MRAQFVFHEVWIGLRRNLTMTAALVVVVAISLSLLGTGLLFVKQVDNTRQFWQSRVQLSVYLCTASSLGGTCAKNGAVTPAEINNIKAQLLATHEVTSIQFVSQKQAVAQFRQEFANDGPIVKYTSADQIPPSFQIRLKNTEADAGPVTSVMNGAPGVSGVINDASILDQFYRLLDGARNAVVAIAIFLLVAAILLVANTIRLSAFNRRRETSIMRLVGASTCGCRSTFPRRQMCEVPEPFCTARLASDPVETGFPGAGNVARNADPGILAGETRLQEGPSMEDTPPENMPGFA